jgi:hypothetical protein
VKNVPPPIHTEEVSPNDQVVRAQYALGHQHVGQDLSAPLNPTDANLRTAGISVLCVAGVGILLAVYNPKYALGIMTGAFGVSILAGYLALTATGQPTAWNLPSSSS